MSEHPNVFEPDFDAEQDQPPFTWRRSRIGRQAGSEKLGASLFELPAGASSFPLHVHHANEELIVVLAGRPTLRSLDGERELEPGDVVACPPGPAGAHRIENRGDEPVRFLAVSTMIAPDIVTYPESNKLWVRDYPPGGQGPGPTGLDTLARPDPDLGYMDGER